jgi:hypothetical protein
MMTCPKCHAGIPEGMRFCLECGASLAAAPPREAPPVGAEPPLPVAAPVRLAGAPPPSVSGLHQQPPAPLFAVPLNIVATPVMTPRAGAAVEFPRPSLGEQIADIDEELLKKAFERPIARPGAVVCRFCRGPLDIEGDFCEQCGAPVAEAAPPGALKPKPQSSEPPFSPPDTAAPRPGMLSVPGAASAPALHPVAEPPLPLKPAAPTYPTPPAPVVPTSPAEERPTGLMGRLKGLFKKG